MIRNIHYFVHSLVMLALMLATLLPFYAYYGNTLPTDTSNNLFGEKILICTAEGFKWIGVNELEENAPEIDHSKFECPLCVVASSDHKAIRTITDAFVSPITYRHYGYEVTDRYTYTQPTGYHFSVRAPPAYFSA